MHAASIHLHITDTLAIRCCCEVGTYTYVCYTCDCACVHAITIVSHVYIPSSRRQERRVLQSAILGGAPLLMASAKVPLSVRLIDVLQVSRAKCPGARFASSFRICTGSLSLARALSLSLSLSISLSLTCTQHTHTHIHIHMYRGGWLLKVRAGMCVARNSRPPLARFRAARRYMLLFFPHVLIFICPHG